VAYCKYLARELIFHYIFPSLKVIVVIYAESSDHSANNLRYITREQSISLIVSSLSIIYSGMDFEDIFER